MKRQLIGLLMVMMMLLAVPVAAGPNTLSGAFIGAGSGALIGQALGRNTEATLAGTFVGGILGAAIGSDMDSNSRVRSEVVYTTHRRPERVDQYVIVDRHKRDQWYDESCQEVDLIAKVDGRREKIKATACQDRDGQWVIEKPQKIVVTKVIIKQPVERHTTVIIKNRPSKRWYRDSNWRRHDRWHDSWERRHRSSIQYPSWW